MVLAVCPKKSRRNSRCPRRRSTSGHHAQLMDVNALFDGWERAWSGRDPGAFAPLCDAGVRYEDPLCPEPLDGPEAIAAHAARLWAAFPDARVNATGERLAGGDFACAPCKVLGTHRGALGRLGATGRELAIHAVVYAELRD